MAFKHTKNEPSLPDFTEPTEFTDITLVVEDKRLYTSKAILAMASPVFKNMFTLEFKEKCEKEIPLPEKKFDKVQLLLRYLQPGFRQRILVDSAISLVPLTDEYQINDLKMACEDTLVRSISKDPESKKDKLLCYLELSVSYGLERLLDKVISAIAKVMSHTEISITEEYQGLDDTTKIRLLEAKVTHCEQRDKKDTDWFMHLSNKKS